MSLKHFHIAFVAVCTLFFAGLGAWCLLVEGLPAMFAVMGWLSLFCGVSMLIYGIRFFKKVKRVV
jgi:arginine exporter protein ArgO